MASGYHIGQYKYKTFPSSKVLLDSAGDINTDSQHRRLSIYLAIVTHFSPCQGPNLRCPYLLVKPSVLKTTTVYTLIIFTLK